MEVNLKQAVKLQDLPPASTFVFPNGGTSLFMRLQPNDELDCLDHVSVVGIESGCIHRLQGDTLVREVNGSFIET